MLSVLLSIAVSSLPAQPACTLARIAPSESKALIAGRDGFPEPRRGTGQGSSFKLTPQA